MTELPATASADAPAGAPAPARGPARPRLEAPPALTRVRARGKFLFAGDRKLYLRGVTYGTFAPSADGDEFPPQDVVESDLRTMAAHGIVAIRTYTAPPARVLDAAARRGVRVLVGLAWEQHVAFLDDPGRPDDIEARLRHHVRRLAGHPAVLAYAVGNEIPTGVVRWHGARRVERFLARLARAAREEDPGALVTYVNYPTTEYLELPFLDFVSFNVFLEEERALRDYVAHLHHVAGERPLVMTEVGLDSRRHGCESQARSVEWQVRASFAAGCAGAFVFAWTDAWHRGGEEVLDWDFGLLDRRRRPKPALQAARRAFADVPFPRAVRWPRVSIVVCTRNGARTIRACCEGLRALDYPDFEVIVVDDGSTDGTGEIAAAYGFRVVPSSGNRGLGAARNAGLALANGEIVAYLDDDAWPDPHWLKYLAATFLSTSHAAVGGPNITPPEDGRVATCVAHAPGGPIHVLLSDLEAEHIPGCNMAFRKADLVDIGGFDPRFRAAGDDVDLCWRLQDAGRTLGFTPAAVVWHHRRNSVRAYWRQQEGYGAAEALLEQKWPERYNTPGHLTWSGRLYGGPRSSGWRRGRIYQGVWGSAPFQSLYHPAPGLAWTLPAMPEWLLATAMLGVLAALGAAWAPLRWAIPLFAVALAATGAQAVLGGLRAPLPPGRPWRERALLRALTALLHGLQPLARLHGRTRAGLTPWRRRRAIGFAAPVPTRVALWSERWREPAAWVHELAEALRALGGVVRSGGEYDPWDLDVAFGTLASARLQAAVEEHGGGRQMVRIRAWPRVSAPWAAGTAVFGGLGVLASLDGAPVAAGALIALAIGMGAGIVRDAGSALAAVRRVAATFSRSC